jgi:diguanylate cyclase (GGDEF)-like protein
MSSVRAPGANSGAFARRFWAEWALWRNPRPVIAFVLIAELIAATAAAVALATGASDASAARRTLVLILLAIVFEETSRRVARLRLRITEGVYVDMTSVWLPAGAIVLPPAYAVALVVVVRGHMWLRHQRRNGMAAYRQLFTVATMMLGCLACGVAVRQVAPVVDGLSTAFSTAIMVLVGLLMYAAINAALVAGAMWVTMKPQRAAVVLGTWEDNALELATLCIGGLTALAVLHQPWLTVLALPPMFVLQRSALVKELEQAASTDSKTGLLNAVAWEQLAKRELSRAEREHTGAAVLIVDLDHFKVVNDEHGHLAGDVALVEVARCLSNELRDYDTIGRFGGEEFVAVLPDVDAAGAVEIAERVRRRIRAIRTSTLASTVAIASDAPLSASIGVSCYPEHGIEVDQLLRAADAALYRAKRGGRNRVEVAGTGPAMEHERASGG